MKPRKPITEESREKMRQAALNRSPEHEANRVAALRGETSRAKMSEALKKRHEAGGREAEHFKKFQEAAWEKTRQKPVVAYSSVHAWIRRNWGKADHCEMCGKTSLSDWANKDHLYSQNREDWLMLCRPCHRRYDAEHLGIVFGAPRRKDKGIPTKPWSPERRARHEAKKNKKAGS